MASKLENRTRKSSTRREIGHLGSTNGQDDLRDSWEVARHLLSMTSQPDLLRRDYMLYGHYAWKLFLTLRPETRLLVVDNGFGSLTECLARDVDYLVCICSSERRMQLIKSRLQSSNRTTQLSFVVAQSDQPLPIADGSMDCLILGSELVGRLNNNARQLKYLEALGKTLRPGGQLFFPAPNRWRLDRTGHLPPEDPTEIPRPSLEKLLSVLGLWYRNSKERLVQRNSLRGYRNIINSAGFSKINVLGFIPNNEKLYDMLPASGSFPEWSWRVDGSWKSRLKSHPALVAKYGLIAQKEGGYSPRLLDDILNLARASIKSKYASERIKIIKYEATATGKVIVFATQGYRDLILKIPMNNVAVSLEDQNAIMLAELKSAGRLSSRVPESLAALEDKEYTFYVESEVKGTPLRNFVEGSERFRMVSAAFEFLRKLNPAGSLRSMVLTENVYARLVLDPLSRIHPFLRDDKQCVALEEFLHQRLYGKPVSVGAMHGNFDASNILLDSKGVSGVFDWGAGSVNGIPAIDAISLLVSVNQAAGTDITPGSGLPELLRMESAFPEEMQLLEAFYSSMNAGQEAHETMVYLFWLHVVTQKLRLGLEIKPDEVDCFVTSMIDDFGID